MDAIEQTEMISKTSSGLIYAQEYNMATNITEGSMNSDGCNLGAMFSLGARVLQENLTMNATLDSKEHIKDINRIQLHQYWAQGLTQTCHWATRQNKTGLMPWYVSFDQENATSIIPLNRYVQ